MEAKKVIFVLFISSLPGIGLAVELDSLLLRSNRELNAGRIAEARTLADEALQQAQRTGSRTDVARATYHLANTFQASENYESAAPLYESVVREADILRDSLLLSKALTRYGLMRINMKQYNLGEGNITYAIKIVEALRDTLSLSYCHQYMGTSKIWQEKPGEALPHYKRALECALRYDDMTLIAGCYQNLGQAYAEMSLFDSASFYTEKAIRLCLKLRDEYYIHQCYKNLMYIYDNQKAVDSVLHTELEYFNTLQQAGFLVDDDMLEPLAYLTESILESYDNIRTRLHDMEDKLQTYTYMLYALAVVIILLSAALVMVIRKKRPGYTSDEAGQLPAGVNSTLEARIQPLLNQKNKMLAPCYALLAAGYTISRIADIMNRDRTTVSHWVKEISTILGIPPEELRADALKYAVCVDEMMSRDAA